MLLSVRWVMLMCLFPLWSADINECLIEGICRNGVCVNEDGGFHCECSLGYRYNPNIIGCEGNSQIAITY